MAEMPNWTKKCQIRIKIQTTGLKLKVTKYFGWWEKWFIQGWNECENDNTKLRVAEQEEPEELCSLTDLFGSEAWKN